VRIFVASVIGLSLVATACVDADPDLAREESELCYTCPDEEDLPQPPPPPPIPPAPTLPADYSYDVGSMRFILSKAGDALIAGINADPDVAGTIAWRGDRPDRCGYACNTPAWAPYPDHDYAQSTTYLRFRYSQWGTYRDISVPVSIRATCDKWATGAGTRTVSVRTLEPAISGGSWLEGVVDFFSVGYLSSFVDAQIKQQLSTSSARLTLPGTCDSLGAISGYPGHPELDAFIWDR